VAKLKNCQFALHIDESDNSNHAQLIAFARFIDEGVIINQFLCCKNLPSTTKGQDVFDILTTYLKNHGLSLDSCIGIRSDGAPTMVGSIKGFVSLVKKRNPTFVRTQCFIHREVLIAKIAQNELKEVLSEVIEIVNFIKLVQ